MTDNLKKLKKICKGARLDNNWSADFDYLDKLELKDMIFLSKFCHFYYHGNPAKAKLRLTKREFKESYSLRHAARRDVLNCCVTLDLYDVTELLAYNQNFEDEET